MCGRFLLAVDPADLQEAFPQFNFEDKVELRYNIAPSQPVLVIPNVPPFKPDYFQWGLIPSWSKDPSIGYRMINARGETLSEKPTFRGPYKYHRCLVLANGFYEWRQVPGQKSKSPYHIRLKNERPFAFAGLWDEWHAPDGSTIRTCTIITTSPNEVVAPIHDRMPVILPSIAYPLWLDPSPRTQFDLQNLIAPYPAVEMEASPVSPFVNNPAHTGPECLSRVEL